MRKARDKKERQREEVGQRGREMREYRTYVRVSHHLCLIGGSYMISACLIKAPAIVCLESGSGNYHVIITT